MPKHQKGKPVVICSFTRELQCPCGWQCEGENNRAYMLLRLHSKVCKECEISNVPKAGYAFDTKANLKYQKKHVDEGVNVVSANTFSGIPLD